MLLGVLGLLLLLLLLLRGVAGSGVGVGGPAAEGSRPTLTANKRINIPFKFCWKKLTLRKSL